MITLFIILLLGFIGEIIAIALKACWSVGKFALSIIFLPVVVIALAFSGLIYIAIPLLVIAGIIVLVKSLAR